jgi:hypothetical protein
MPKAVVSVVGKVDHREGAVPEQKPVRSAGVVPVADDLAAVVDVSGLGVGRIGAVDGRVGLRPSGGRVWTTPWSFLVGVQSFASSGAPYNRPGYFNDTYLGSIFLLPRRSAGRLPTLWGANLSLQYSFQAGPATVTLQGTLYNVFNAQKATAVDAAWSNSASGNYPNDVFDPNQPNSNSDYGKVTGPQDPRLFRSAVKISF